MSLVPRQKSARGHKNSRITNRPGWDSTVTDLSVHRPSQQELERRHLIHQPSKIDLVREELCLKRLEKALQNPAVQSGKISRSAVLKEILYGARNRERLEDVLADSDRTMALVNDLFGDQAGTYEVEPRTTSRPSNNIKSSSSSSSVNDQEPDVFSSSHFVPDLDLDHYKKVLEQIDTETTEKRNKNQHSYDLNSTPNIQNLEVHSQKCEDRKEGSPENSVILEAIQDLKNTVQILSLNSKPQEPPVMKKSQELLMISLQQKLEEQEIVVRALNQDLTVFQERLYQIVNAFAAYRTDTDRKLAQMAQVQQHILSAFQTNLSVPTQNDLPKYHVETEIGNGAVHSLDIRASPRVSLKNQVPVNLPQRGFQSEFNNQDTTPVSCPHEMKISSSSNSINALKQANLQIQEAYGQKRANSLQPSNHSRLVPGVQQNAFFHPPDNQTLSSNIEPNEMHSSFLNNSFQGEQNNSF